MSNFFNPANNHQANKPGKLFGTAIGWIFFFCCSAANLQAQQKLTGIITDEAGKPLEGVTVINKATNKGTQTDSAGFYSIMASAGNTLQFSFVGHDPREIKISSDFHINLTLPKQSNDLNEVVVTGYVSEKIKNITGAVVVVKPNELTSVPAGQTEPMLQGRAAGLNVITQATPGSATLISIHGFGNFGLVTPLYIIDGTPGNINDLNPDDIESLQVLKDAGSAAIYGVRGANGAIVITTRKGKPGKATISFDNYLGYQVPLSHGYPLLNSQETANATLAAYTNSGIPFMHPQYQSVPVNDQAILPYYVLAGTKGGLAEGDPLADQSKYNYDPSQGDIYQIVKANPKGTDWLHEVYHPAFSQNYTLTASGGSNKSKYLFSLGYLNQQGTLINTYLKRFTVRINTEFNILDNIRLGENLELLSREVPDEDAGENPGPYSSGSLTLSNPVLSPYDIKNHFYIGAPGLGQTAPVYAFEDSKNSKRFNWAAVGNVFGEVDFAKYFTFRTSFGGTFDYDYYYYYQPMFISNGAPGINSLTEGSGYGRNWSWQNTVSFHKTFQQDHSLKILAGTEYISNYGRNLYGSRSNFFTDDPNYSYLSNGSPTGASNGSSAFNSTLYSMFARLDYGYLDKYLFGATVRRDGSSVFGSENRYGVFPSFSGAWRISKEEFAAGVSWLSELKLRGSWGQLGFDGNTPLTNQFTLYGGDPASSFYDIAGTNTSVVRGIRQVSLGNKKTGWQTDIQTDIGLDGILWNNKLSFSLDWWVKKSTGLLFPLALPYLLGGATSSYVNVGDVDNYGFDIMLGTHQSLSRDLKIDLTTTVSVYRNKIVKLNDGQEYFDQSGNGASSKSHISRNAVGHPMGSFYGYKIIGFFNSEDDVIKSPKQDGAIPGEFKYLDANGDHKISDSDRVFFGNPNPKFSLGFNIGLTYKNFDFSTFFYGVFGNDVINNARLSTDFTQGGLGAKSKTLLHDSWTPSHLNAKVSINEVQANFSNVLAANSYPMEDGSYFRNKSMIIGYSFNQRALENIHIKKIRIYAQVTNLFTITKYTGLDPETTGTASFFGIDNGNYPNNQKQWLMGLNIGF